MPKKLTKSQIKAIAEIKRVFEQLDTMSISTFEIKLWEIQISERGTAIVRSIIGPKDANAVMDLWFTTHRQIFVGRRGGLVSYDRKSRKITGRKALYASKL